MGPNPNGKPKLRSNYEKYLGFFGVRSVGPTVGDFLDTPTPRKINMEPRNHPIEKENHLPNRHDFRFQPLIFQGVWVFP